MICHHLQAWRELMKNWLISIWLLILNRNPISDLKTRDLEVKSLKVVSWLSLTPSTVLVIKFRTTVLRSAGPLLYLSRQIRSFLSEILNLTLVSLQDYTVWSVLDYRIIFKDLLLVFNNLYNLFCSKWLCACIRVRYIIIFIIKL